MDHYEAILEECRKALGEEGIAYREMPFAIERLRGDCLLRPGSGLAQFCASAVVILLLWLGVGLLLGRLLGRFACGTHASGETGAVGEGRGF